MIVTTVSIVVKPPIVTFISTLVFTSWSYRVGVSAQQDVLEGGECQLCSIPLRAFGNLRSFSNSFQPPHPVLPLSFPDRTVLGCPVQLPTSSPTRTLFLLTTVFSCPTSLAVPQLLLPLASQPMKTVIADPTGYLPCQPVLMPTEPVGMVITTLAALPSQWRPLQLFSWLTSLLVMLSPIQSDLAVMPSLSFQPIMCSLR